ncbi:MAG: hypothetical protein J6D09_02775 [Clostridia bacterium]|nr:hypothetical protein [Clostridia bacterium]
MKRKNSVLKIVLLSVAACLIACSIIGGSIAWLMTKTDPVVNTFTFGDINITLTETTGDTYKMMPGKTLDKDPVLTVKAGSENCWVFVKIDESQFADLTDFIEYEVADGWTALTGVDGVYYRTYDASAQDVGYGIIKGDVVKVKDTVTKDMLDALNQTNYPKLSFTGYAVQRDASIDAIDTAEEAWALIANP